MSAEGQAQIINKYGFHVRPSTSFSQLAQRFTCSISVTVNDVTVDGKNLMGLMTLGATCGSEVHIEASGDDEQEAVEALIQLIKDSFGGIE